MSRLGVICYHRVLPDPSGDLGTVEAYHRRRGMLHSLSDFRRQLDVLQQECVIVGAGFSDESIERSPPDKPRVLLTFDDGYEDFATVILPELTKRSLPCVLFPTKAPVAEQYVPPRDRLYAILASDYRGRRHLSEEERERWVSGDRKAAMQVAGPAEQARMMQELSARVGLTDSIMGPAHMQEQQIEKLPASVYLGAHGLYHHEFASLTPSELKLELEEILGWIRKLRPGQGQGAWLAYPNGKADRCRSPGPVAAAVQAVGVNRAFLASREFSTWSGDPMAVPRIFSRDGVDYLRPIWDNYA